MGLSLLTLFFFVEFSLSFSLLPASWQATWLVHRALMQKLKEMPWKDGMTMLDFYHKYYVPFGELLTDMER